MMILYDEKNIQQKILLFLVFCKICFDKIILVVWLSGCLAFRLSNLGSSRTSIHSTYQYKFYSALGCLSLFFNANVFFPQAQAKSFEINPKLLLKTAVEDFGYIAASPLRTSKADGIKFSILSVTTTGFVFYLDERILEECTNDGFLSTVGRKLAYIGKEYGREDSRVFYLFGGLSTSMLTGGLLLNDRKLLKTTGLMTESFVFASLIMGSVKMVMGRWRPYTEKDSTDFDLFAFSKDRDSRSMPSGHTSSAFAMMTVIAKQYNHWWIKIPAYAFATSAALQRIESRQHWVSDVLVGGVIGYFVANTLVKKHVKNSTNEKLSLKTFVLADRSRKSSTYYQVGLFFLF